MPADRDDDDTPADEPKSSRGKKRFQERDDKEDDDDRPRRKRSRDDDADDDDAPKSKRRAEDDDTDDAPKKRRSYDDDDAPKKKRRASADDGPRVKTNDNIPIVMLLAFIGSALALLVICGGCGFWSFDWLVGGGEGFAGGGGATEFEVTSASRQQQGFGINSTPSVSWTAMAKQPPSNEKGQYYIVMKCGSYTVAEQINHPGKGGTTSSTKTQQGLKNSVGKTEVHVDSDPCGWR